jgi:hypothetical protein
MKKYILLFILPLFLFGCDDWLDINVDPNNPAEPDLNKMLPGIYYDVAYDFGPTFGTLGYVAEVYTHRLTTREHYDQYGINGSSFAVTAYWSDLYTGPLQDLEVLINKATEDDNVIYAGIGKVMKAYIFSMIVDLWGDAPFTDATKLGNFNPKFDSQTEIYASLLEIIDGAIADFNNEEATNILVPGSDDLIYNGSVSKWIKAANSLKLKLYNQVRLTDMYDATEVDSLISNSENLIGPEDNFLIPFGTSIAPDNRNPAFVSEYSGGQISNYISPWFYEVMVGENPYIFTGINDPRTPYYFANQLASGEAPENPTEYQNGNFASIYFGSVGPHRDGAGRGTFAMMGVYPVGGAYNDDPTLNKMDPLGISAGNGAAPHRLITYADVLYIQAELALSGKTSADARALLDQGIEASFDLVNLVVDMNGDPNVPYIADTLVTVYKNDVMALYDATTLNSEKMEIVINS